MAPMFEPPGVVIGIGAPSLEDVVAVARDGAPVSLAPEALEAIAAQPRRRSTRSPPTSVPHYGVSTGFGALATLHIPVERRIELQRGLIRSHAAGSGDEVEREVVRALMLLRLSTLATGPHRRAAGRRVHLRARCSPPASRRSCTSTARSAAPATSRRCRTARWR